MKVSLVFPPFLLPGLYNLPPLGVIMLATILNGKGHGAVVRDFVLDARAGRLPMGPDLYDACARKVLADCPDVVGFSAQCATYPAMAGIASRLKKLAPEVFVAAGGHNATFLDRETLASMPFVDAVVRGEGEETFPELVDALASGRDLAEVRGITFRRDGRVARTPGRDLIPDLDALPKPDYSLAAPLEEYKEACGLDRSIAIVEAGRGCPHACVYCSESRLWRRRVRTLSPGRLVEEMAHLRGTAGAECFLLSFDQFTADRDFVADFCTRLLDGPLDDPAWYCISRLDTVDRELLDLMRRAGCESMCYGIDSGSERTLSFIRKRIDRDVLAERVRVTTDSGISPTLSFVVGFPEEERSDVDQTLMLALETASAGEINPIIQLPTVLAGTELHARYADKLVREADTYFALGLEFHRGRRLDEDEERIASDPAMYSSFYNLPCPGMDLAELDRIALHFPVVLRHAPRSFMVLSLAPGGSASTVFASLLDFVAGRINDPDHGLCPDCLADHYLDFVRFRMDEFNGFSHLPDLARYEIALSRAGAGGAAGAGNAAAPGSGVCGPVRASLSAVYDFQWDMPAILDDLRHGQGEVSYPQNPSTLAFVPSGGRVEAVEINRFGKEFLDLCDGSTDLDDIARALFTRHGHGMDLESFAVECRRAADGLAELALVRFTGPETIAKEVPPC